MSASNSRLTPSASSTSNEPPPISELWPNFGAISVHDFSSSNIAACKNNGVLHSNGDTNDRHNPYEIKESNGVPHNPNKDYSTSHNSNNGDANNTNYVNFNQFIRQHNLLGVNGGRGGLPAASQIFTSSRPTPSPMAANSGFFNGDSIWATNAYDVSTNNIRQNHNYNGGIDNYPLEHYQSSSKFFGASTNGNCNFGYNYNGMSGSADVAVNNGIQDNRNGVSSTSPLNYYYGQSTISNGNTNHSNINSFNNYYDDQHSYATFTSNGTTYYNNPFATGLDFAATQLLASAPEFVPRFNQLSLNDEGNGCNINNNVTDNDKTTAIDSRQSQLVKYPENGSDNSKYDIETNGHKYVKSSSSSNNNNNKDINGGSSLAMSMLNFNIKPTEEATRKILNNENKMPISQKNGNYHHHGNVYRESPDHNANNDDDDDDDYDGNVTTLQTPKECLKNGSTRKGNHNNRNSKNSQDLKNGNKKTNNRLEKNIERFSRNMLSDSNVNNTNTSNSSSSSPSLYSTMVFQNNNTNTNKNETLNNGNVKINGNGNGELKRNGEDKEDSLPAPSSSLNMGGRRSQQSFSNQNNATGRGIAGGRNSHQDSHQDREERFERYMERTDRTEMRGHSSYRGNRDREYYQRYDNHRSNKRRDDWNRNRDRTNGSRMEEKLCPESKEESVPTLNSPDKVFNGRGASVSPVKQYPENEKLSQREKLIRDIETRRLECLVCVESIKAYQSVWSCQNCYHIMHLMCIVKWASASISEDGWRCPACQNVEKKVPTNYYCFCGKTLNPTTNRKDLDHSCGEVCGRVEGCTHACTLLCHPGPCPPCQANVKRECGCGRTSMIMQCYMKDTIECDDICDKLLACENHRCEEKCHQGKCPPCNVKIVQHCYCNKHEREVLCTKDSRDKRTYSCGKPCGHDLSCGNHKCKDCCHAGDCRPCKLSPELVITCPCGKKPVAPDERKSCLDPIPVCDGVCGKTLRCGKPAHPHRCVSKCHLGNCPPCNKQTMVKCRCGHMDQMIKCRQLSTRADDARCKKRCVKKRSCGKHKCNKECCIDIDHICPLPCNYTLSCGKHKCDHPCHRGNCPPCYRSSFEELYCECGAEVIYPPVPCGTKRPICKKPCSRKHPCDHPPQHNCHAANSCPPCMMFTTKWCYGQHEQRKTIPCSQNSFSCGLPCNKPLPCGRHKCIKSCHEGPCQLAGEICKQSCPTIRTTCIHKCAAPCHEGSCPETPCKEVVEVQCLCGHRKQMRPCHELAREYSRIATAQLASSMAEMQRGNYMELSEILAPIKVSNKSNKTLDCNEECRVIERNRRLEIGFNTRKAETPQKILTKYSDFIKNFAKRDPSLVKSVHEALTSLVKLAKESKQKSRSHSFPTMNREKRQLVHEMCEAFGVDSVAYDAEPNRNVVATAYKNRCWFPAMSVMEVVQRESGQRRVPLPSINALSSRR